MIARIRSWWDRRRLDWAQSVINRFGLTVVKLHQVGTTTYLIDADGSARRLETPKRKAAP